ncbi:2Fe-2S iron-sulfur cluster-binding protein [Acetivibrio cellulolyticus]|uniref:2Fe-2S iron-sulfur cluster-binding protein n=1 Tax=Acetivibrio cellulolyticus TaxID=35830 RepID=UPI0001E2DDFE|nr:2Fe-2S iron-sulfur cluster binding domain-containing protein [Acetivibrio cellulolyticus]
MNIKFFKETEVKKEKTILDIAEDLSIKIKSPCNGKGKCGKCIVKVISGKVSEPTKCEEDLLGKKNLGQGYRLACETTVIDDTEIELIK